MEGRGRMAAGSWKSEGEGVGVMRAAPDVVRAAASGMEEEEWMSKGTVGAERWEESGRMERRGRMAEGSWKSEGEGVSAMVGAADVMRAASS